MKYKLYVLVDPNTRKIRYVGQTSQTLYARLHQHIWHTTSPSQPKHHVNSWIKQLLDMGKKPILRLVCSRETLEEMDAAEIASITRLREKGYRLCNITSGGDGHYEMSEETKEKRRLASLGEKNPFFGKKHSRETKQLIGSYHVGVRLSPEHKRKAIEALKLCHELNRGVPLKQERRDKIGVANSRTYILYDSDGMETCITNLKRFCAENNLNYICMNHVTTGRNKTHRGWTKQKISVKLMTEI